VSEAIRVENLTKLYRRAAPGDALRTLKSALLEGSLVRGLAREAAIVALDGLSFSVGKGEAFGVIGGNGSGKSTLLKTVAGILAPTSGRVVVDGRVSALIELGAGFHPEISGRENVFINAAVLGLSRREAERRFDAIVDFAGLADFIDEPVKNYSSGMYVRLGFAVAIHTDPEVLLVDEVLAVGDEAFAHRCLARIEEFLAAGRTLLLVSHSLALVEERCDRALWLEAGRAREIGEPRRVIDAYRQAVAEAEGEAHRAAKDRVREEPEEAAARRWGSGEARIEEVRILARGGERHHLESGEEVTFELRASAGRPLSDFVFGVAISTPRGVECWGTNTDLAGLSPVRLEGEATVRLVCPELRLAPGEYRLDAAVHARDGAPYDYRKGVARFTVTARARGVGVYFRPTAGRRAGVWSGGRRKRRSGRRR
jgi:ABC-type polysaccharide/polyol phosphate transport system ATPase subunit